LCTAFPVGLLQCSFIFNSEANNAIRKIQTSLEESKLKAVHTGPRDACVTYLFGCLVGHQDISGTPEFYVDSFVNLGRQRLYRIA
jgi:hypothetical protein